ncbi:uncharacterized protein [Dysidea avara]|uniref:uncharacterized protein isoform X2 n=1 Tax=Dysidea avara TaxID=196820 RepID=UPI0033279692
MNVVIAVCSMMIALRLVSATDLESTWNMICNENVTRSVVISASGTDNQGCLTNELTECKTLAYVLNNTNSLNDVPCLKVGLKDVSMVHYLPSEAPSLTGINFYMVSETGRAQITCSNSVESSAITSWSMQNAEVAIFKLLMFSNCRKRLAIKDVSNVYFQDVTFSGFSDSGLRLSNCFRVILQNIVVENCSSVQSEDINFPENGAVSLTYRNSSLHKSSIHVLNSQFNHNSISINAPSVRGEGAFGDNYPGRGGGLGLYINELLNQINLTIDNCMFNNNSAVDGGGVYISANGLSGGHRVTITNSVFNNNKAVFTGAGIFEASSKTGNFSGIDQFNRSYFSLSHCNFSRNVGDFGSSYIFVISLSRKRTPDRVSISDCIFDGNSATTVGSAIQISSLTYLQLPSLDTPYNISNCTFINNISPGGMVGFNSKDIDFRGTILFMNNHGPAIRAADSLISVHGDLLFINNTVEIFDGTIFMQDFVQLQLFQGSNINFTNNTGVLSAAFSVFVQEYPRVFAQSLYNPWCFLAYENLTASPSEWENVRISFETNNAFLAPNIYASGFQLCSWQNIIDNQTTFSEEAVLNWTVFNFVSVNKINYDTVGNVNKSNPVMFSTEDNGIRTAAVSINGTMEYKIRPGEQHNLNLTPYDSFGKPTAFVFGISQVTDPSVFLTGQIARYLSLEQEIPVSAIFLDITVEKCLPGYVLRHSNDANLGLTCACELNGDIISCDASRGSIDIKDGLMAFNHSGKDFSDLKILPCPPTYCQCEAVLNSTMCIARYYYGRRQLQCHPHRTGNLCGACKHDNDGVGVLSMLCQECEDLNVFLLILLVLVDIVLVVLILLSATPFPPELKGILFYIQTMPYAVSAFPLSTWRGNQIMLYISSALSLYFPWDFCLYKGMSAIASSFFSYIPCSIAVIIIVLVLLYRPRGYTSARGIKFQRTYTQFRTRCSHGIWTLILLMYLRVLYISFAAFDCVDLPVNGLSWYIDGNVKCFSDHGHILLFIVGIVVSFLMTLPMLFIGLLPFSGLTERYATLRYLTTSASYGYKMKFKWWGSVELGRRFYLAFFWYASHSAKSTLQIFLYFATFALYIYFQPYEKSWHNWVESFLLAYSIILLSMRSTTFVVDSLLPNKYTGVMLPNNITNINDATSSLPPNNALTYFFVPLLYLPLLIGLVLVSYLLVKYVKNIVKNLRSVFQALKKSYFVTDEEISDQERRMTQEHIHTDSGVTVVKRDSGRVNRVQVTYAEF